VDVECLAKRGYVTELSEEAERQLLVKIAIELHTGDLTDTPASLMFVPAYMCNLHCPYCFQPHDYHQGRGKYSTILSRDLVDANFRIGQEFHAPGALARHVGLLPEAAEKKLHGTFPTAARWDFLGESLSPLPPKRL
jgi:uncharacterized protein